MSDQATKRHGGDKCISLSEKSQYEKATYCIIPTRWHSGKGKTMETLKRSLVARGWWREEWIGRAQRIFKAVKLLCMILWWWLYVTKHLSKPTECTTPRVNPNVNYGLQVIMMCWCKFTSCSKCTLWWGMLIMGETMHVWGQRAHGKSLYFSFNFALNLKLL